MERLVNDSIVKALAAEVAQQLHEDFTASWGVVLSELARTRESNEYLQGKIAELESRITMQNQQFIEAARSLTEALSQTQASQRKAAAILNEALKEMGVEGE